ncbi:MAG: hypothetical protein ACYTFQ_12320 [Planctomycetota bacterium]|jgi:hypothetical protein
MNLKEGLAYVHRVYGSLEHYRLDPSVPCTWRKVPVRNLDRFLMRTPARLVCYHHCGDSNCIEPRHMENLSELEVKRQKGKRAGKIGGEHCIKCGSNDWAARSQLTRAGKPYTTRVCRVCDRRRRKLRRV